MRRTEDGRATPECLAELEATATRHKRPWTMGVSSHVLAALTGEITLTRAALADRPDGSPPGVEAALDAAARGVTARQALIWDELRPGDQAAIKSQLLPIVLDACRGQIGALRG